MGINCSRLPDSRTGAIGFGGSFTPKTIGRVVSLTFKYGEDEHKIRLSNGFMVICIPPDVTGKERENMLRYTPNVLGMDILTKFEVRVKKRRVELRISAKS